MTELRPPPEHAHLRWHWLAAVDREPTPWEWNSKNWVIPTGIVAPELVAKWGWRYHGPCIPNALPLDLDSDATMTALASTIAHAFWADGTQETIARAVLAKLKELGR